MSRKNTSEHFWSRVAVKSEDECWEWLGSKNCSGYGNLSWRGTVVQAHRVAAWLHGTVDTPHTGRKRTDPVSKFSVLHKCDNRCCCNPSHLEVGDLSKNQRDCYTRQRRAQPAGSKHSNAKLTDAQVVEIRAIYVRGGTRQIDLAKCYGVSQRVISLVVRRETYR